MAKRGMREWSFRKKSRMFMSKVWSEMSGLKLWPHKLKSKFINRFLISLCKRSKSLDLRFLISN
jgi:hypothetical protein